MKIYRMPRSDRVYKKLPREVREQFRGKVRLPASSDLRHLSLCIKKIRGTTGFFEASINMSYRFTFQIKKTAFCCA